MVYALLLLFFVLEYVRPTSYIPALIPLKLNSIVPLASFVGSIATMPPAVMQRLFTDSNTLKIVGIYGLVWMSVITADVQQRAADAQSILLGFVIIYFVVAAEVRSVARIKGVIKVLILVHVIVAALNPLLFTDPGTRHYITTGSFLGDGNDFALSLDVVVPLCLFLLLDSTKMLHKVFWGGALLILVAAVVATQSRGGTLGLAATGAYYWSKSNRKLPMAIIGMVAVIGILAMAPGAYFARLATIGDTTEGSAQGRLTAWSAAIRMAADNPLFGVGAAHFGIKIGNEYRPEGFIGCVMTANYVLFL
jgi:O-antigen ligase